MKLQPLTLLITLYLLGACVNKSEKKETPEGQEEKIEQMQKETTNQTLLGGKLQLYVSEEFSEVTETELIKQFPNERQRPTVVFQASEYVKLSINYGSSPATINDLPQIKQAFESTYNRSGVDFRESKAEIVNGTS